MGGKGGGGGPSQTQSSTSTVQLPAWLEAAGQGAVAQAQNLASTPYTAYTGQLVADPSQMLTQAYQGVENLQGFNQGAWNQAQGTYQGLLGQANPLTAQGVNQLANQLYGNYNQAVTAPSAGLLGGYLGNASPATAQQVASNTMQLMSPYEQAVIAPSMQAGQQALAQNLQGIGAAANQANAFGGSRQGVMEGVAQAQTSLGESQQIANLLNTGYQANITPATSLAMTASGQGYNAANTLAGMLQSGYGNAQTQGQNIANTNLGLGMTSAAALPGLLSSEQQAQQAQLGMLQAAGTGQQQQQQAELNAQYGQFLTQQAYPYQQLQTLLGAISSVPYGQTTVSTGTGQQGAYSNPAGSIIGGIGAAGGLASGIGSLASSGALAGLAAF